MSTRPGSISDHGWVRVHGVGRVNQRLDGEKSTAEIDSIIWSHVHVVSHIFLDEAEVKWWWAQVDKLKA